MKLKIALKTGRQIGPRNLRKFLRGNKPARKSFKTRLGLSRLFDITASPSSPPRPDSSVTYLGTQFSNQDHNITWTPSVQVEDMAMAEAWFGDTLERKYSTSLEFNGITTPKDCHWLRQDSSNWRIGPMRDTYSRDTLRCWKPLKLFDLGGMFSARIWKGDEQRGYSYGVSSAVSCSWL